MKRKATGLPTEDDLLVDLTLHDVPATLFMEFAEKIVRPYYSGNISKTLRDLICNAIGEEDFLLDHIKTIKRGDHG